MEHDQELAALFEIGDRRELGDNAYVDHYGIGERHVPALLTLARRWVDDEHHRMAAEDPARWAPYHALRALGELGTPAAIPALLDMLDELERSGDELFLELFPTIWARFGATALEPVGRFVLDPGHRLYARTSAARGLRNLAQSYPELRNRVLEVYLESLQLGDDDSRELNGFIVWYLVELEASEHAEAIAQAFDRHTIDPGISGDGPTIAYELGVGPPPEPRPLWQQHAGTPFGAIRRGTFASARAPRAAVTGTGPGGTTTASKVARAGKPDKAARKRQKAARKKSRGK